MGLALIFFIISLITWISFWVYLAKEEKSAAPIAVLLVVSIFLTVYWFWTWLPWFQPLFFTVFYNNLGLWLWWLIILGIAAVIGLIAGAAARNSKAGLATGGILFGIGFVAFWIVYGVLAGSWTGSTVYNSLDYKNLQQLPDTTAIRQLPMEVAWRYGENRLQEPGVKHGDADPIVVGEEVDWLLARVPKGFWNEWLRNADGFTIVNGSGDVTTIRQKMEVGEGMLGSDNIIWKLRQQRYWSKVAEIYYVQGNNNEVIAVAPYLDYSLSFPVMVPHWGGVFLVHSSGKIEDLSPEQAKDHPLLKGVRIFPEELARLYANAYAYKKGISNVMFRHEDQIEIPSVGLPGAGYRQNEMPFLLPTELGQKWFVAAVPWGAEGIYRIFLIDAITGSIDLYVLPKDSALIGPNRARGYITRAYPYFDWDKFYVLEPRPIMRAETLYWMFTVTPTNFAGVTDTVLVNSRSNEVLSFGSSNKDLLRFLRGENTGKLVGIGETSLLGPSSGPGQQTPVPQVGQPGQGVSPENIRQLINDLERLVNELKELERTLPQK
ncbi:MAG: hypothetical protein Q7S70_00765 [bacterium]|nr:hypothetical protein [bacterium]